jgi:hypothetical protein
MELRQNTMDQFRHSPCGLAGLLAAEFVDRCGDAAIGELVVRRDAALEQGDDFGAEGWRHVLLAAECILADMRRRLAS